MVGLFAFVLSFFTSQNQKLATFCLQSIQFSKYLLSSYSVPDLLTTGIPVNRAHVLPACMLGSKHSAFLWTFGLLLFLLFVIINNRAMHISSYLFLASFSDFILPFKQSFLSNIIRRFRCQENSLLRRWILITTQFILT